MASAISCIKEQNVPVVALIDCVIWRLTLSSDLFQGLRYGYLPSVWAHISLPRSRTVDSVIVKQTSISSVGRLDGNRRCIAQRHWIPACIILLFTDGVSWTKAGILPPPREDRRQSGVTVSWRLAPLPDTQRERRVSRFGQVIVDSHFHDVELSIIYIYFEVHIYTPDLVWSTITGHHT